jgi:hypothetical protein
MKSVLRGTVKIDVEMEPAYRALRKLPLKERDDIATASLLADAEESLLEKYRLLRHACLCRLYRKHCRCRREGREWMCQAHTSFSDLWDHPRLFENRTTGECILILHPYGADQDSMKVFIEFCEAVGLEFHIQTYNAYHPSRAFAIIIQKAGGEENVDW